MNKAQLLAQNKHKEALSHIKAVRYLDKEAEEAAAAATIIQARFRGYQARSILVREMQEAKNAEAKASEELKKVESIKRRKLTAERQLKKCLTHHPKGHEKVLQARKQLAQVSSTNGLTRRGVLLTESCLVSQVEEELAAARRVAEDALVFASQERADANNVSPTTPPFNLLLRRGLAWVYP